MSATLRFHASNEQAEINVTPLIDVLLALVVILMIAAPLTMKKIGVPLAGGHETSPPPRTATLSVLSTGELFLDGNAVNRAQLGATLEAWANSAQPPALDIRADRETSYEKVASALALAQRSGLAAIRIQGAGAD